MKTAIAFPLLACLAGAGLAQDMPPSIVKGSPPGFNYPMSLEAVAAAPENHRIVYEDAHVRFLEVTLMPYVKEHMHGHAYTSVFAVYQAQPPMDNEHLTPWVHTNFGKEWRAPGAPAWPECKSMGPQAPHSATIVDDYPQHFFRLEFKREEATGFSTHWRDWYPDLTQPGKGAEARKLWDNGLVSLIEVAIRPGATAPAASTNAYTVNAYPVPADAAALKGTETPIASAAVPSGLAGPSCTVTAPGPVAAVVNAGTAPIHYYRIAFRRVDGDAFPATWQQRYPAMGKPATK